VSANAPAPGAAGAAGHRHEAVFYAGLEGFLDAIVPFVREGVAAGEPVLVVVGGEKLERLRAALGTDAEHVRFADMDEVGANPARIIPFWRAFVDEHAEPGRALRGVGEPVDASRRPAELAECHRHEALLNVAFADATGLQLLCPYDVTSLTDEILHEAERTHPAVRGPETGERASARYPGARAFARPLEDPLPRPPATFHAVAFDLGSLVDARRFVAEQAAEAGLDEERTEDLVLAVSEIAANSVRHGGGAGVLRSWTEPDRIVCEIRDRGVIGDPLAGRVEPAPDRLEGRGLWLANQLCDLVQVRAYADGGAVRLHVRR
jgi:anti-sigma regulatory factor (Ser/Thr protein kinase)